MAIEEEICGAGEGGSFLHDDYTYISDFEIEVGINVKRVDCRRQYGSGGERENLICMT